MKAKIKAIPAMALAMVCLAGGASAANIVVNGNFDGGTYSGPNGDVVPTGWTVGPPSYVIQSVMNVESTVNPAIDQGPESGLDYIAFQSPATSGRDCLYQDLDTAAGQTYNISFWVAITGAAGSDIGLSVIWDESTSNSTSLYNSAYYSPANTGPMAYEQFNFTEIASTNLTRIDFHAVDSSGAILLDNVVVQAQSSSGVTPEPVSMLLGGTGLLLVGLVRRRR